MSGFIDKDPADKDLPDEQQLDEYLKGGSSVSQQYRQLRSSEVPAELDRLVLRQAQEAVKKAAPMKSRAWMRWTAPLAVAASAVLVMSIIIESGVQKNEVLLEVPASAPAPEAPTTMEAQSERETADGDTPANASAEVRRAPAPVPDVPTDPSGPQADVYLSTVEPPPSPAPESPPAESRRERGAAPVSQTAANQPQFVHAKKAADVLNTEAADKVEAVADVQEIAVTSNRHLRGMPPQTAGPRGTVEATRPASAVVDSIATREVAGQLQQYSDPELWLRDIRNLRLQDKQEEADREWRRFRAAFPDHPVAESDKAREQ